MADFLNHLLMRSVADVPTAAVLQPRLPSLFETMPGRAETPLPSLDSPIEESSSPAREPSATGSLKNRRDISHVTTSHEHLSSLLSESPSLEISSKQMKVEAIEEIGRDTSREIQPANSIPAPVPPGPLTFSSEAQEFSVGEKLFVEEDQLRPSNDHHKEFLTEQAQVPDKNSPQMETIKNSVEIHLKTIEEVSLVQEDVSTNKVPVPPNRGSKPVTMIRPVPTPSLSASPQALDARDERPQIVEVHIGRIEVRATPTPSVKRPSQKTTTMSLDEYLRSRPGEKR